MKSYKVFYYSGVWTVGNIGREQGTLKWPLLAAYAAYPVRYYIYDETVWFTLMVIASSLAFDSFSKEWRRTRTKRNVVKSVHQICTKSNYSTLIFSRLLSILEHNF